MSDGTRTRGRRDHNPELYQLSYAHQAPGQSSVSAPPAAHEYHPRMELLQPASWDEALEAKAGHPEALPLWGGTDVMVDINFGRARPETILDLTRVERPHALGHATTARSASAPASRTRARSRSWKTRLPGLAIASRTVGSPQIRNRGTIGGNLGSSSPAGDALPPLYASGAEVELASTRGTRRVPIEEFITGPKRNVLEPDELIAAFHVPAARGGQQFSKVGTRNAMVIAVCSFALAIDDEQRTVGTCLGSAAPTPRRAHAAEDFIAGALDWDARGAIAPEALAALRRARGGGRRPDRRPARHARPTAATRSPCSRAAPLTWAWAA